MREQTSASCLEVIVPTPDIILQVLLQLQLLQQELQEVAQQLHPLQPLQVSARPRY